MVRHEDELQDDDQTNEQRLLVHEAERVVEQRLTVQESEDREQGEQVHLARRKKTEKIRNQSSFGRKAYNTTFSYEISTRFHKETPGKGVL